MSCRTAAVVLLVAAACVAAGPPRVFRSAHPNGLRFALVANNPSDFWSLCRPGIARFERETGGHVDLVLPANGTAAEGDRLLAAAVAAGQDGVAVCPADPAAQRAAIDAAAAVTNVVCWDADCPASARLAYVGVDDVRAGEQVGRKLVELLPRGGRVGLFVGQFQSRSAADRTAGIERAIAGHGLTITVRAADQMDHVTARQNVEQAITADPPIDAAVGLWSYEGPVLAEAIGAAHARGRMRAIGFDPEPATLAAVRAGTLDAACVSDPAGMAYATLTLLRRLALSGDAADLPPGRRIDPGTTLITRTATTAPATRPVDPAIAAIRDQGLNHSQVMATLDTLCNVIGPRLTASPGGRRASEWTRDQLATWGLADAHLEPWGPFGRGWAMDWFSFQTVQPYTVRLGGVPKAWSPGLDRPIEADVVYVDARTRAELEAYRGKLRGKIVLIGRPRPAAAHFAPQAVRMDDAELARLASVGAGKDVGVAELMRPATRSAGADANLPAAPTSAPARSAVSWRAYRQFQLAALNFLRQEGAAVVVDPSTQGDGGTVYVAQASLPVPTPADGPAGRPATGPASGPTAGPPTTRPGGTGNRPYADRPRAWSPDAPPTVPQVTLAAEDYNRLVSLLAHGQPVRAAIDLRVTFTPQSDVLTANTVADLPGTDLKDQVVMVGGHLDSWHGGTGATDNGVGAAAAMEAIRILKAAGLHPRRTVRVALWTGEEQGLYGSTAYVTKHFGYVPEPLPTTRRSRPATRPAVVRRADYEKLSAYFNLDNGTGRIRGLYAQSNPAAAALFRTWLAPVADLGAGTVTLADTGSTDHVSFDDVGLPGFQFIQDPIEYGSRTHHSTADTYDRIQPDDMRQAATVMAVVLWDAANAPDRFPRKSATRPAEPR